MRQTYTLVFLLGVAVWCSPGFAAPPREVFAGGPQTMTVIGALGGVDMTGQGGGGSLNVGVSGTQTDVFSANNPLGTWPGVAISTDDVTSNLSDIVFLGSSTVYGDIGSVLPGGPYFRNIFAEDGGATINFLGSVFARTLSVGTGTVNFESGTITNAAAANFTGDGTITVSPNTKVTGALTTTAGAQTGTLEMGSGSEWLGAVGGAIGLRSINVVGGSNAAGVSATITGSVDSYAFSLGTNTLNVAGAITMHDAGVINTTLASPTVYGHIVPTGSVTLGATLGVNVLIPSTAYIPVGTQFDIIESASGTDGSIVSITAQSPTNPLYTFSAVPLSGTLNGIVKINTDTIPLQTSTNPAVPVLQNIPSTPDLDAVLAPINALTDPAAIDSAVAQLAPSTPALAAPLAAFRETRQFQGLWLSHLDTVLCRDSTPLDKDSSRCEDKGALAGMWVKGFGSSGSQEARNEFTAYDVKNVGGMLAYDVPVGPDTRAGLGIGYGQTSIDGETFDAGTDFETYQLTGYMGHVSGPVFLKGGVSFAWNEYETSRHIVFPGLDRTANADYSGQNYTVFVDTGYSLPVEKFMITPIVSLQYSRVNVDGYTETGAGDVSLKVDSQSYDLLESGLGVKVERPFTYRGGAYVPEVHVKWLHEFLDPSFKQTAAYTAPGSSKFTTAGLKADDMFNVGAGLTFLSCACSKTTWSAAAVYDYGWTHTGYAAHQVMAKIVHRF